MGWLVLRLDFYQNALWEVIFVIKKINLLLFCWWVNPEQT